jgi:hypothetical protein
MDTRILLLGLGLALFGAACGRSGGKPDLAAKPTESLTSQFEIARPIEPPQIRTVPASSDGALELLGIHPASATLQGHPAHLLQVRCTFDHPLEGDVVARFLGSKGVQLGRTQQHIKTDGSPKELEFRIAASIPTGDIVSIQLKLPQ